MAETPAVAPTLHTVRLPDAQAFGPADMPTIVRWTMEGRVPKDAMIESSDGGPPVRAVEHPIIRQILGAPPTVAGPISAPSTTEDAITTIIPYRNGYALAAYYVGVFSLIPVLGVLLAVGAIVLGIVGLKHASKNAHARGRVHAWVGIVLGTLVLIAHGAILAALAMSR